MENHKRYLVIALIREWGSYELNAVDSWGENHEDALERRVRILGPADKKQTIGKQFVVVGPDNRAKFLTVEEREPVPPLRAIPVYRS